ncbi:hypothetical protein FIBSPDRAFT_934227 [Athelia psychrophila]|uniref:Exportin-2 central domain-containing protein n=1 Tax=Athelia psychrophila TaxID=1759441 RepID=A0A166FTL3_9AGAM|nr:hypothetical protein FIBSPDRAFT_934227 [Fibularhizoctonia sp. CBS 109695]
MWLKPHARRDRPPLRHQRRYSQSRPSLHLRRARWCHRTLVPGGTKGTLVTLQDRAKAIKDAWIVAASQENIGEAIIDEVDSMDTDWEVRDPQAHRNLQASGRLRPACGLGIIVHLAGIRHGGAGFAVEPAVHLATRVVVARPSGNSGLARWTTYASARGDEHEQLRGRRQVLLGPRDLQAAAGTVEPILQVDAIRYLYTFRNQLADDGMVVAHERAAALCAAAAGALSELGHYVCYTYAPITIDRALFIKKGRLLLFMQADSHAIAPALPNAILLKIESAGSAERVAEKRRLPYISEV